MVSALGRIFWKKIGNFSDLFKKIIVGKPDDQHNPMLMLDRDLPCPSLCIYQYTTFAFIHAQVAAIAVAIPTRKDHTPSQNKLFTNTYIQSK